jgi:hypothetical protein
MYEFYWFVAAGSLMSYGPKFSELFRRAAYYVDRIRKGARPGDLPMEQTTRSYLLIDLKTAKGLGLTIPPALLLRADEVISEGPHACFQSLAATRSAAGVENHFFWTGFSVTGGPR